MQRKQRQIGSGTHWMAGGLPFALALALVLAAPGAWAEIYAWRTEDGGYAYTDDRDNVPARYASRVEVLPQRTLASYARFTPQDDTAVDAVTDRLAARLERLRAVNQPVYRAAPGATAAVSAPVAAGQGRSIALSTGDARAPEIQVPMAPGSGPVVVEPVLAKQTGEARTRRVTVIRQDGETLAVIKGNRHHFNIVDDIHDEADLEAGEPLR